MMDASELAALRAALVMRLEVLRATSETTVDNRRPVELDQTSVGRLSRMDAMQVQAMALATERYKDNRILPKGFRIADAAGRLCEPIWHGRHRSKVNHVQRPQRHHLRNALFCCCFKPHRPG